MYYIYQNPLHVRVLSLISFRIGFISSYIYVGKQSRLSDKSISLGLSFAMYKIASHWLSGLTRRSVIIHYIMLNIAKAGLIVRSVGILASLVIYFNNSKLSCPNTINKISII